MNLLRASLAWTRPAALAMALLAASAGAETTAIVDPTDDAFGILLAMPGAQPKEGGWIVPQQPARDEADLIAQLTDLKKDGANFNAMRHGGTLLAHALRAGKDRTALWLLRNGAGTRKLLSRDDENADDLARKYRRAAVVKVLEGRYGLKPTPPTAPARKAASASPAASTPGPTTRVEQTVALMQRLDSAMRYGNASASAAATQEWQRWSSALSRDEFASVFKDGYRFDSLVFMTRKTDNGLQEALDRLPDDLVRRHAQAIADVLADSSFATYGQEPRIEYTNAARAWPALWRRLDRPLRYDRDRAQVLAGNIPPALWPGLFASGYANHEADVTGCLLAMVDLSQLQALWPDFQRDFADARDEAPGLVLGGWRVGRWRDTCPYASEQPDTAAKLAFLRAQGVTAPAYGLRSANDDEPMLPALAAMVQAFTPPVVPKPRLVSVPPQCEFARDERWLDALVKPGDVGWGVTPSAVQLVDLPGRRDCGVLVSGNTYPGYPDVNDDFDEGPSRELPMPRCADLADDGEIWALDGGAVRRFESPEPSRGARFRLAKVRDLATGKDYVFDTSRTGAACNAFHGLPSSLEWQAGAKGSTLAPSPDAALIDRLLLRQCTQADPRADVVCEGIAAADEPSPPTELPLARLHDGQPVSLRELVDVLGADRRAVYQAALAAHDHAQLRRLLAAGIPPWWTAAEIEGLAQADLPLEEKRRRIALLFADPGQLRRALADDGVGAAGSLGPWLPRQDWGPVLRLVLKSPATWGDARRYFGVADDDRTIGCDLDHAQGFLCGGGLQP